MRKFAIILLSVLFFKCSLDRSSNELLNDMNKEFPEYNFSDGIDFSDVYMTVKMKKEAVDSVEIQKIYCFYEKRRDFYRSKDSNSARWIKLVFYNPKGDYVFTVCRTLEDKIVFFRDGEN